MKGSKVGSAQYFHLHNPSSKLRPQTTAQTDATLFIRAGYWYEAQGEEEEGGVDGKEDKNLIFINLQNKRTWEVGSKQGIRRIHAYRKGISAFLLLSKGRKPLSTSHYAAFPHPEMLGLLERQAGPWALLDQCPNLPSTGLQGAREQLGIFCCVFRRNGRMGGENPAKAIQRRSQQWRVLWHASLILWLLEHLNPSPHRQLKHFMGTLEAAACPWGTAASWYPASPIHGTANS